MRVRSCGATNLGACTDRSFIVISPLAENVAQTVSICCLKTTSANISLPNLVSQNDHLNHLSLPCAKCPTRHETSVPGADTGLGQGATHLAPGYSSGARPTGVHYQNKWPSGLAILLSVAGGVVGSFLIWRGGAQRVRWGAGRPQVIHHRHRCRGGAPCGEVCAGNR